VLSLNPVIVGIGEYLRQILLLSKWLVLNAPIVAGFKRPLTGSRPVPIPIMNEIKKYVTELDPKQEKLFVDCFKQYRWNQLRKKLGLVDFKFHDLRKTFGSVLAQNGISTAVIQKLLEHSSSDLTNKVYMNVDPVLRKAVDQIPAGDWL